ncbi:uncharacterized protein UHOD_08139 [Ustilago sp. UG-2017b]|nr:uncharacterized protein UHOD_08139 [Ustilago sp. UG-2017b]
MKLSGMFRIGFVAAIVTALILLPSCIAPDTGEASTSTAHPSVEAYTDHLNTKTISTLSGLTRFKPGEADLYDQVPFIHTKVLDNSNTETYKQIRAPLYSVDTPPKTVEQALRDHGSVGIVDVSKNDARLINLIKDPNGDRLEQTVFTSGPSKAIRLFQLPPDLHLTRTFAKAARIDTPPDRYIEDLAYANGKPILREEYETLGHMLSAVHTTPEEFYYIQIGKPPILVTPKAEELFQDIAEQEEVLRIHAKYLADKQKYGKTIASLTQGKPIIATADPLGQRKSGRGLRNYAWFDNQATRDQMVTELQHYGRFRVYQQIDGKKYKYKVKVSNPGATEGRSLKVYVKPLSFMEGLQEEIKAAILRNRFP